MALDSYSGLSTAIGTWGRRTYTQAQTDEFIALAEALMNRELRHYRREARDTVTCVAGAGPLPADFRELIAVVWPTSGAQIERYAITGDTLTIYPEYDIDLEIVYVAGLQGLASGNTTNWVLEQAPDAYFWLCRAQAAAYHEEWETAAGFEARGLKILNELVAQSNVAQLGRAEMTLNMVTP